ncbi:hydantoinase/oxoprolinase N-terminal domain-containing protein [Streptosporangium roseum]|uniref:hydantoinase/oxoprolinase N-terminal domain-containing protein n=1 Tax=Streptosporangium roseum TaxID=2001 RepID=UPI00332DE989
MSFRTAMDIGGTFTDVVRYDERTGRVVASKAPTTPGNLADGVFSALGRRPEKTRDDLPHGGSRESG